MQSGIVEALCIQTAALGMNAVNGQKGRTIDGQSSEL